jgi:hypothetical protein
MASSFFFSSLPFPPFSPCLFQPNTYLTVIKNNGSAADCQNLYSYCLSSTGKVLDAQSFQVEWQAQIVAL